MVVIVGSSSNKYAYHRLGSEVVPVLACTNACKQLQRWWKVFVALLFIFTFLCLFNLPLRRHHFTFFHQSHYHHPHPHHKALLAKKSLVSVLATDRELRTLASQARNGLLKAEDFIHPNANQSEWVNGAPRAAATGPRMNTVPEMLKVTEVSINIKRPCRGANLENGADDDDLEVVIFLFCVVGDFSRRQTIRETYGSALKGNPQTEIYFVLGRTEDET